MLKVPSLRRHVRGQWFCRWGGKDHWFGTDLARAQAAHIEHIRTVYMPHLQARERARAESRVARAARPHRVTHSPSGLLIVDAAHLFLEDMADRGVDPGTVKKQKYLLRPLLSVYGEMPCDDFTPELLLALRKDLRAVLLPADLSAEPRPKYGPKTLNHITAACKSLFAFATVLGVRSIDLRGVRAVRVPEPVPNVIPPAAVAARIAAIGAAWRSRTARPGREPERDAIAADLEHMLALNYLAAMRPTALLRLVAGAGRWHLPPSPAGAVFELHQAKTANSRNIVLSPEALTHLFALRPPIAGCPHPPRPRPRYAREDGYSQAVRRAAGAVGWPHALRHCAASHLGQAGVPQEDIDNILGHCTRGALRSYLQIARERLLPAAARLTLESFRVPSSSITPAETPDDPHWAS